MMADLSMAMSLIRLRMTALQVMFATSMMEKATAIWKSEADHDSPHRALEALVPSIVGTWRVRAFQAKTKLLRHEGLQQACKSCTMNGCSPHGSPFRCLPGLPRKHSCTQNNSPA